MATTVEITAGDDGAFTVGIVDQPSAEQDDAQQVGDIAQALAMAKHLLENPPSDGDADDTASGADTGQPQAAATAGNGQPGAAAGAGDDAGAPSDGQAMWDQLAAQQGPAH